MALKFHVWDLRLRSQGLEVDLSAYAVSLDLGGWDCCGVMKGFGQDCGRIVAGFWQDFVFMLDIGCARLRDDRLRQGVGRSVEGF